MFTSDQKHDETTAQINIMPHLIFTRTDNLTESKKEDSRSGPVTYIMINIRKSADLQIIH